MDTIVNIPHYKMNRYPISIEIGSPDIPPLFTISQ